MAWRAIATSAYLAAYPGAADGDLGVLIAWSLRKVSSKIGRVRTDNLPDQIHVDLEAIVELIPVSDLPTPAIGAWCRMEWNRRRAVRRRAWWQCADEVVRDDLRVVVGRHPAAPDQDRGREAGCQDARKFTSQLNPVIRLPSSTLFAHRLPRPCHSNSPPSV